MRSSPFTFPPSPSSLILPDSPEYDQAFKEVGTADRSREFVKRGGHVHFAGRTNYIKVPSLPGFGRTTDCSFSCWFRVTGSPSTSAHWLFNHAQSPSNRLGARVVTGSGNGKVDFGFYNGSAYVGITTNRGGFEDGQWHFVTCVCESGTLSIFIDGVDLTTSGSISSLSYDSAPGGEIGYQTNGNVVSHHRQSDACYWSKLISLSEHNDLAELGLTYWLAGTGAESDLLARYPLQDNSSGAVYDSSGNGKHGSWRNYDARVWRTDPNLPYSHGLRRGHSVAADGHVIPRDDSVSTLTPPGMDVLGNDLDYEPFAGAEDTRPMKVYALGNSLTFDALAGMLGRKSARCINTSQGLTYHVNNPSSSNSVDTFYWEDAVDEEWDVIMMQPYVEDPLQTYEEEMANIQTLIDAFDVNSPNAIILIHEGWAYGNSVEVGTRIDNEYDGYFDWSDAYFEALVEGIEAANEGRDVRRTRTNQAVFLVSQDIAEGTHPLLAESQIAEIAGDFGGDALFRDNLHINWICGRYLIHNCCRRALGMPNLQHDYFTENPNYSPALSDHTMYYLDSVINRVFAN